MTEGCMTGCGRMAYSRGQCVCCYNATHNKVKRGKTTWEAEIAAGRALAATTPKQRRWNAWVETRR